MDEIDSLHEEAMDYAEDALVAKRRKELQKYQELIRKAFELESQAVNLLTPDFNLEPTRSILYRSAASLALECAELREAERFASLGIIGNPPPEILQELREIMEKANFERHLIINGRTLSSDEVQVTISGNSVSSGMAEANSVLNRLENIQDLIYRTVERLGGKNYRKGGLSKLAKLYNLYFSAPYAGSFAITIRIGETEKQLSFPEIQEVQPNADSVVDELLTCIKLFNDKEENSLKERFGEEAYYNSFVTLMKEIAPDGNNVSQVGFTTLRDEKKHLAVGLTRKQNEISSISAKPLSDEVKSNSNQSIIVKGVLKYADAISTDGEMKIVESGTNKQFSVIMPEGTLTAIVRNYWDHEVEIIGTLLSNNRVLFKDITKLDLSP